MTGDFSGGAPARTRISCAASARASVRRARNRECGLHYFAFLLFNPRRTRQLDEKEEGKTTCYLQNAAGEEGSWIYNSSRSATRSPQSRAPLAPPQRNEGAVSKRRPQDCRPPRARFVVGCCCRCNIGSLAARSTCSPTPAGAASPCHRRFPSRPSSCRRGSTRLRRLGCAHGQSPRTLDTALRRRRKTPEVRCMSAARHELVRQAINTALTASEP